jgi:hypothetical protein
MEFFDKNRGSPNFNHLNAVNASISALSWVTVVSVSCLLCCERDLNNLLHSYTSYNWRVWKLISTINTWSKVPQGTRIASVIWPMNCVVFVFFPSLFTFYFLHSHLIKI